MSIKIYKLDPSKFPSASGLAWQTSLKMAKGKLHLLNYIAMLLMVEKSLRGGISHSVYWYVKAYNKCMKYFDKS